tara:strand:- start:453 stop:1406 length:954 start_codon:yes stop_codon:yes gene_type:complete
MSKNLLKEAIADAKAVRSTAIANAKLALEEAFTPKLQSMLSQKIAEEMDDELEEEDELETTDTSIEDDEASVADTTADAADTGSADEETVETGEDVPAEESYDEGVEGEEEMEEDLELEAIIRELEDEDESEETVEEETTTDAVGVGGQSDEADNDDDATTLTAEGDEEEVEEEEEMDLEEIIKSLQEEDEETVEEEETEEAELEEAYKVIRFLKSKINEVNLLNSKLLYSNKLFRSNNLNETQKVKVIETFDRANSVREVKLVYSTLAESLTAYTPKKRVNENFASNATKSTRPSKNVIVEANTFATRMQRLAGLK